MAARNGAGKASRIVGAAIEVFGRHGYHGATLGEIAVTAGVTLQALSAHYATREECFLAAYRQASAELVAVALEAYGAEPEWVDGLRAGLDALLLAAAAEPARARVCFVEAQAAGLRAMRAREQTISRLEALFDRAPSLAGQARWTLLARSLVGGLDFIIGSRIAAGRTAELPDLTGDLAYLAATPFIGEDAAKRMRHPGGGEERYE